MSNSQHEHRPPCQQVHSGTIASLLKARSQDEVYEILLDAAASEFEIIECRVIRWTSDGASPEEIWTRRSPSTSAHPFSLPSQWSAPPRDLATAQCLVPEDTLATATGGSSLIAVPLELPLSPSFQLVLFQTPARISDPVHNLVRLLESVRPVAALTLANLANYIAKEQDRQALNEAVESVPLGVLAIASDQRILICNRNTEFIFNLRRIEILGKKYSEVLPKVLSGAMADLIRSISRWEDTFDREFTYAVDPRTTLRIGMSVVPMTDDQDKVSGYVFILRDMTLTREAQTLRELNILNLEFIQTVSHEIKAPLMAVLMGADYLMARATNFNSEQRETLQTIDEGAQRLHELVANLLDLVNFESGHASLELEWGDLTALANRVVRAYRKLPNLDISLEVTEAINPFRFDSRKIHRVIENLVSNAIKYSGTDVSVKIALTREDDHVRVAVSDCGIGIQREHLPYIWDKFYRICSPSENTSGSGLGLSLVKQIIVMHRGEVSVQSEINKGTTFSFTLPLGAPLSLE